MPGLFLPDGIPVISTYQTSKLKYWSSYFFSLYFLKFIFIHTLLCCSSSIQDEREDREETSGTWRSAPSSRIRWKKKVWLMEELWTKYAHFKHDQKHTVTSNSQPDNNRKNSELHIKVQYVNLLLPIIFIYVLVT